MDIMDFVPETLGYPVPESCVKARLVDEYLKSLLICYSLESFHHALKIYGPFGAKPGQVSGLNTHKCPQAHPEGVRNILLVKEEAFFHPQAIKEKQVVEARPFCSDLLVKPEFTYVVGSAVEGAKPGHSSS